MIYEVFERKDRHLGAESEPYRLALFTSEREAIAYSRGYVVGSRTYIGNLSIVQSPGLLPYERSAVAALLATGTRTEAVKFVRGKFNLGLKEALEFIDAFKLELASEQ